MRENDFLRKLWFLIILLSISGITLGQSTANYAFTSSSTGSLVDMSSGTSDLLATGTYYDDVLSAVTNIGFNFYFMGTQYTQFSINSNGQLRLGSTAIVGGSVTGPAASTTYVVAMDGDNAIMTTGKVHYKVTGSSPNRVLIVEWKDLRVYYGATGGTGSLVQVLLNETSGVIEFRYGTMYNNATFAVSHNIFISSNNTANNVGWLSTITGTPAYNTGATLTGTSFTASSSMTNLNSSADGSRTVFTFTPPATAPADPTGLNFTSVTGTTMTLNWNDNATNESGYYIYRSLDGTNYTLVSTQAANTITYPVTGLSFGTTYYWRIVATNEGRASANLDGSQATVAGTISGVKTVGGSGSPNYATLTAAFSDISTNGLNGAVQLALQSGYDATTETFPLVAPTIASATNTITVYPAVTGLSIYGSSATGLINLNAANYIIFDGRVGMAGTAKDLIIKNSSLSNFVIQFINDASNNTVKYCSIQGSSNTSTIGLVNFSTTTGTTGNDNNLIDNCDIRPALTGYVTGIYSGGTSGKENSSNTISNCNIYDFKGNVASTIYAGINLVTGSSDWTISSNSFYQTTTVTFTNTAIQMSPIIIGNTTGNNFVVTNNYIGGSSANCGGTAWTQTGSTNIFIGIRMSVGSTVASSVQGNVIQNISQTTTSTSTVHAGISLVTGSINAGNITGNTIGSATTGGNIALTYSGAASRFSGILAGTGTPVVINISNNTIDGITLSAGVVTSNFYGIYLNNVNATYTVNNNTIGGSSAGISLTTGGAVSGIYSGTPSTSQPISNNYVQNITLAGNGQLVGIYHQNTSTSVYNTTGNTIRNLSSNSNSTSTGISACLIGIIQAGSTGNGHTIATNIICNLANTTGTAAVNIYGIVFGSSGTGCSVSRNNIYNLTLASTATAASITGIYISAGTTTYSNNMICLGNGVTTGYAINGINEFLGTNNVYFNNIYIGGSTATSDQKTFAFFGNQTSNTRSFRNNIFINTRSSAAGTGKNYSVKVGGSSANPGGLTIDYNIYLANGTQSVFGFFNNLDVASLAAWQTAVGQDAHSVNVNPLFVDPTNSTPNLHLQNSSPADVTGIDIPSITVDFDGQTRANLTPVDIGADAGIFDVTAPTATYNPLNGATDVAVGGSITITFNETVRKASNDATLNDGNAGSVVALKKVSDMSDVTFTATYNSGSRILTISPSSALNGTTEYQIQVTDVEDISGNACGIPLTSNFTTGLGDLIAPNVTGIVVQNAAPANVVVSFNENVKLTSAAGVTITVGGSAATINTFSGSGSSDLTFTLATAVISHQTVTFTYTSGNITDMSDNPLGTLTDQSVTNNVLSNSKDFITFSILQVNNPGLSQDYTGSVGTSSVTIGVPNTVDVTNLIATFTTSNYIQSTKIGAIVQVSGTTPNNFTSAQTYVITAEDGTTKNYNVSITKYFNLPINESAWATIPPANWSKVGNAWYSSVTTNAAGTSPELKLTYSGAVANDKMISPAIYTQGLTSFRLKFKYLLDDFGVGATLRVQSSTDKITWTNEAWSLASVSNTMVGPNTVSIDIVNNVGSITFIAFVIQGTVNQIDNWYIDNVEMYVPVAPTVTTTAISSNITGISAASGGTVSSDGGDAVTAYGVCWGTSSNPTILDSKTTDGTGTGSYASSLSGLTSGLTYHVRAYATNAIGTSYGDDVSFTTPVISTITTTAASNIMLTTAQTGGEITSDGGATVTLRGVCYSTSANPTILDNKTSDGGGTGSFISNLNGLTAGTTYHFRAYATNGVGTAYGSDLTFTTYSLPAVTTTAISSITMTTASSGGNVTSDGGATITARGVCWSTSSTPTIANSATSDGTSTGAFTSSITGLTAATTYYVRAYVTTAMGTTYGDEVSFTTYNVPVVTTASVTNTSLANATGGGNVTSDGGTPILARGICWSKVSNPTLSDSYSTDGTTTGVFTSNLISLDPGYPYHVRAYATNAMGTVYGNEVEFNAWSLGSVSTYSINNITSNSAQADCEITNDGWASITARGVCWSTLTAPTLADSHTSDGTAFGTYTSTLVSLSNGTTYYVRSYITNEAGTSYGNQLSFTTLAIPTISTTAISLITTVSAQSGGEITANGGSPVTVRGICWSIASNPTTADNKTTEGAGNGSFSSNLTGLSSGTSYHVRAYATNAVGTAYGNDVSFTTIAIVTATGSGNWDNPAIWGGSVPGPGDNVVISSGMVITIPSTKAIVNCNDLTLAPLADLSIDGTLNVNGNLLVQSDITGSGSLIDKGTLNVTGTKTVQLYIAQNDRYYYVSMPVAGITASAFGAIAGADKLYYRNTSGSAWVQVTNPADVLVVGRGYATKQSVAGVTLSLTGNLNSGAEAFAVETLGDAWNLVGNPYPSPMDWGTENTPVLGWNKTNIRNTIYIKHGDNFAIWNAAGNGASINGGTQYIPAMQSFWVKALTGATTLDMNNLVRVHNGNLLMKGDETFCQKLRVKVSRNQYSDEALIQFNSDADNTLDKFDAEKMFATGIQYPQVYTQVGTEIEAINTRAIFSGVYVQPLGFKTDVAGRFTFDFSEMESFTAGSEIFFKDKVANKVINLMMEPTYIFTSEVVNNGDRFVLHFSDGSTHYNPEDENGTTGIDLNSVNMNIYSYESTINVRTDKAIAANIKVYNLLGLELKSMKMNGNSLSFVVENPGTYVVKVIGNNGTKVQKVTIK